MEKVTFSIPAMWADHHTLAVRQVLGQVSGVEEVIASAMYKDVLIKYDPATVSAETLQDALVTAGYQIAEAPQLPSLSRANRRYLGLVPIPGTHHRDRHARPGNVRRSPQVLDGVHTPHIE